MGAQRSSGEIRAARRSGTGPTYPPPPPHGLSPVLERNIRALQLRRQREEKEATVEERVAEAITRFTGSMQFVYLHVALLGFGVSLRVRHRVRRGGGDQQSRVRRLALPAPEFVEAVLAARLITVRERDGACVRIGVMEPRRGLQVNVPGLFCGRWQCLAPITCASAFWP